MKIIELQKTKIEKFDKLKLIKIIYNFNIFSNITFECNNKLAELLF